MNASEESLGEFVVTSGDGSEMLKGDRKGQWSVWISGNYRLIFEIEGEHATNVNLEDYH